METKIIKRDKNPFLEREEIIMEVISETAPSFEDIKAIIGKDANLTIVKKIQGRFGKKIFIVEAVVYDNVEVKNKIETIPQKVRKKMEAEKKVEDDAKKKVEEEARKAEEEVKVEEKTE
ncbi:MAG: hypothetical protein ABIH79_03115 [archaeon]